MKKDKGEERVKASAFECIHCDKFFECKLKEAKGDRCVNFVERRSKNGKNKD